MSADPNRLERRAAQRFEIHQSLSLAVHFEGLTVPGFIQNLSGRGIFFYAETALPEGAVVELTFTMPSEITLAESMPVRGRGRVLRASASPAERFQAGHSQTGQPATGHSPTGQRNGIAVRLDSYQYLPSDEPIFQFVRVSAASAAGVASGPAPR
jgi:hypothetical protein